ncbi:MAG: hypothetical protein D6732_09295, partial [Methanobacteriota archaeon]
WVVDIVRSNFTVNFFFNQNRKVHNEDAKGAKSQPKIFSRYVRGASLALVAVQKKRKARKEGAKSAKIP